MPAQCKTLFVEIEEPWQRDYLEKKIEGICSARFEACKSQDIQAVQKGVEVLSVFVNSRVTEKDFARFPDLRLIATRSTGFDHIDLKAASAKGIQVANVPVYGENTVAEHAFALILSLARNLRKSYFKTREGDFSLDGLMGFDLNGKTLGVVGTGHIGLHVIRMAKGFGMNALAFDVKENSSVADALGFKYVPLDE